MLSNIYRLKQSTRKRLRVTVAILLSVMEKLIRPLTFESWFSVNRRVWNFIGDIAVFCLDIKQEFFIFNFSMFHIKI